MSVQGVWESYDKQYVNVTFTPCDSKEGLDCESFATIEDFLENNYLIVYALENFINFENIEPIDETLKTFPKNILWNQINNVRHGKTYLLKFTEH